MSGRAVGRSRQVGRVASAGVGLLAGAAALAYTLSRIGVGDALRAAAAIGPAGFGVIVALAGARLAARAAAWTCCIQPPHRLPFRTALAATVAGNALGNLTPFASAVAEPARAVLVRRHVPLGAAAGALIVENICYVAGTAAVVAAGAGVLLSASEAPPALRMGAYAVIGGAAAIVTLAIAVLMAGARPASRLVATLRRHLPRAAFVGALHGRVRVLEDEVNLFGVRYRRRLATVLLLEAAFHAAGFAETYVALSLVAPGRATVLGALVLESTGRAVTALFEFIPMRLGVDEAGGALVAGALGMGSVSGVAVALVRKARLLVWGAIGLTTLAIPASFGARAAAAANPGSPPLRS